MSSGDRISPRPSHHHLYNDFFGLETSRVWFWPTTLVPSITGKSPGPAPSLFSETVYSVVWEEDAVSSHPIHFHLGVLHPVARPQEAWTLVLNLEHSQRSHPLRGSTPPGSPGTCAPNGCRRDLPKAWEARKEFCLGSASSVLSLKCNMFSPRGRCTWRSVGEASEDKKAPCHHSWFWRDHHAFLT